MLFVEHDMDMVHEISDWVVVMAEGRIIAEGPPAVIGANQEVIDAYLGAHQDIDLGHTAMSRPSSSDRDRRPNVIDVDEHRRRLHAPT